MTVNDSIKFFRDLIDSPVNRLVEHARECGRRAVAYTCSYVPVPLVSAGGLIPVRMRAPGISGTPMADTYMSSVTCPYTRSILEFALDGCYADIDGWIFTGSCDHLRRLYDNLEYLEKPDFNFMLDLPHKTSGAALDWYTDELRDLAASLSVEFDVDTGNAALEKSISEYNDFLSIMRKIADLRKTENPPITGADFHALIVACSTSPLDAIMEPLGELAGTLEGKQGTGSPRARLLVAGSHISEPDYIGIIESTGGLVVADRHCFGSVPGLEPLPAGGDPVRSMAEYYLRRISCPRMMEEFDARVGAILEAVNEYRADGVILETMKFCDCWGVESSPLTAALREAGVPALRLEREYATTGEGQVRTRVQAFMESLGK